METVPWLEVAVDQRMATTKQLVHNPKKADWEVEIL